MCHTRYGRDTGGNKRTCCRAVRTILGRCRGTGVSSTFRDSRDARFPAAARGAAHTGRRYSALRVRRRLSRDSITKCGCPRCTAAPTRCSARSCSSSSAICGHELPTCLRSCPDYLAERERQTARRFLGIATDGATFIAYELARRRRSSRSAGTSRTRRGPRRCWHGWSPRFRTATICSRPADRRARARPEQA